MPTKARRAASLLALALTACVFGGCAVSQRDPGRPPGGDDRGRDRAPQRLRLRDRPLPIEPQRRRRQGRDRPQPPATSRLPRGERRGRPDRVRHLVRPCGYVRPQRQLLSGPRAAERGAGRLPLGGLRSHRHLPLALPGQPGLWGSRPTPHFTLRAADDGSPFHGPFTYRAVVGIRDIDGTVPLASAVNCTGAPLTTQTVCDDEPDTTRLTTDLSLPTRELGVLNTGAPATTTPGGTVQRAVHAALRGCRHPGCQVRGVGRYERARAPPRLT